MSYRAIVAQGRPPAAAPVLKAYRLAISVWRVVSTKKSSGVKRFKEPELLSSWTESMLDSEFDHALPRPSERSGWFVDWLLQTSPDSRISHAVRGIEDEMYCVTDFDKETNVPMRVGRKAIEGESLYALLNLFPSTGRSANSKEYPIRICWEQPKLRPARAQQEEEEEVDYANAYTNNSEDEDDNELPEYPDGDTVIKQEVRSWKTAVYIFMTLYILCTNSQLENRRQCPCRLHRPY